MLTESCLVMPPRLRSSQFDPQKPKHAFWGTRPSEKPKWNRERERAKHREIVGTALNGPRFDRPKPDRSNFSSGPHFSALPFTLSPHLLRRAKKMHHTTATQNGAKSGLARYGFRKTATTGRREGRSQLKAKKKRGVPRQRGLGPRCSVAVRRAYTPCRCLVCVSLRALTR